MGLWKLLPQTMENFYETPSKYSKLDTYCLFDQLKIHNRTKIKFLGHPEGSLDTH